MDPATLRADVIDACDIKDDAFYDKLTAVNSYRCGDYLYFFIELGYPMVRRSYIKYLNKHAMTIRGTPSAEDVRKFIENVLEMSDYLKDRGL